jgi:hypothetical protein
MKLPDERLRRLGRAIYEARLKEAWGAWWVNRDVWPKDDRAWREFLHNPIAEVELILVQAKAAIKFFEEEHD